MRNSISSPEKVQPRPLAIMQDAEQTEKVEANRKKAERAREEELDKVWLKPAKS